MKTTLRLGAALTWLGVIVGAHGYRGRPIRMLDAFAALVASLTQAVLALLGIAAERAGSVLYVPGAFRYDISIGCTGLLPALMLIVAILASPGSWAVKRRGLVLGVPLVLAVNVLRLVHLFWIGIHRLDVFDLAHSLLWEATIVVFTFMVWLQWTRWAAGRDHGARFASPLKSCNNG